MWICHSFSWSLDICFLPWLAFLKRCGCFDSGFWCPEPCHGAVCEVLGVVYRYMVLSFCAFKGRSCSPSPQCFTRRFPGLLYLCSLPAMIPNLHFCTRTSFFRCLWGIALAQISAGLHERVKSLLRGSCTTLCFKKREETILSVHLK